MGKEAAGGVLLAPALIPPPMQKKKRFKKNFTPGGNARENFYPRWKLRVQGGGEGVSRKKKRHPGDISTNQWCQAEAVGGG